VVSIVNRTRSGPNEPPAPEKVILLRMVFVIVLLLLILEIWFILPYFSWEQINKNAPTVLRRYTLAVWWFQ
jgi:hypothetical protein